MRITDINCEHGVVRPLERNRDIDRERLGAQFFLDWVAWPRRYNGHLRFDGPNALHLPLDLGVWNRVLAAVPYVHVTISVKYCRSVSEGQLCVRQGNDRIVGAVTPAVVFRQVCAGDELRNFSLYVAQ